MTELSRRRTALIAAAVLYTAVVAWATLRPLPWATQGAQEELGVLSPRAWTDAGAWVSGSPWEVALNVLMFLPIGLAAGLLLRRAAARIGVPVVITLAIELLQIPLVDRISHPRDLLANALGAALGLVIAALVRRRLRSRLGRATAEATSSSA